jgi:hypothetical protein
MSAYWLLHRFGDGKISAVQVIDAKEHTIEIRFLLSAANPTAAFDLRCHVREKMIQFLRTEHPYALPRLRAALVASDSPVSALPSDDRM